SAHRRYEYDAAGRLSGATSDGGRITLAYDALGRLVEEAGLVLGHERRVQHRYDALGNRIGTLLPDGREITQRYYGPGYLDQIGLDGEVISTIERDSLQRETVRSQGALTSYFDYDAVGRRVAQRARRNDGAQDLIARRYVYDKAGNLQAMNDLHFGQSSYQYDVLGRLTRADKERFAFDPAHNLVESAGEALRANRLVRYGDKQFRYDTHGNLVEKRIGSHSVLRLSYDPDHQLEAAEIVRNGVVQKVSYGYDAFGRRSWKRDGFGTTTFLWHGDRLLQEIRNSRCLTYVYEPDSFVPLAQIEAAAPSAAAVPRDAATVRYFHTDQVGTPRELSDSDGRISWRASYRAWGNTLQVELAEPDDMPAAAPAHQPLRFQGQYFDAETGLHYNRFRYYDPDIGRFVSQDPIGLAGGLNSYLYAPNPIGWADPLGLACLPSLIRYKPRDELTAQAGSRQDAIDRAWALEKELLQNNQVGTRAWSPAERNMILNTPVGSKPGQLSSVMSGAGYTGHHINSVKNNGALGTKWQGDPRNIVFLENHKHPNSTNMPNAYNEHFHSPQGHRGSTNNTSRGRLIDRQAMIDQAKRGCQ
ncbi:MAG TPA: RHS repeat-associated core domain-containing protein, partial [Tahibacter sp.]|nr:RHS repeat-associated core domain-containing protein [Tahibacter sp.]